MRLLRPSNKVKDDIRKKFEEELSKLDTSKEFKFTYDVNENLKTDTKSKVIISANAYVKIKTLVNNCSGEVGWNGTVEKIADKTYLIKDILVYPQIVSSATVTCDELETGIWLSKLPDDIFNNLRFQAHSHVNMATSPSGTDRTMFEKYFSTIDADDDNPFYIFMIFNKKDEYYVEIVDVKEGLVYHKNDIQVSIEGMKDFWDKAKENIETISTPTPKNNEVTDTNPTQSSLFDHCRDDCSKCTKKTQCMEHYLSKLEKEGLI